MNEAEIAEKFSAELDAVLNGSGSGAFAPDQGAMDLAASFARADFSADSKIKESLREKVAGAPGLLETLRAFFSSGYARAAFAAAVLLVAVFPLLRRSPAPVTPSVQSVTASAVTAAQQPVPAPAPAQPAPAAADGGIFASLPMPELKGRPIKDFPIAPAGRMRIAVSKGREVSLDGGSGIVWETEGGAYMLERRPVAPGELFEIKTL
jgi:hypothetical protein